MISIVSYANAVFTFIRASLNFFLFANCIELEFRTLLEIQKGINSKYFK